MRTGAVTQEMLMLLDGVRKLALSDEALLADLEIVTGMNRNQLLDVMGIAHTERTIFMRRNSEGTER